MEHSPLEYTKDEPEPCSPDGTQKTFSFLNSANDEGAKIVFGAGEGSGYFMGNGDRGRFLPKNGHFRSSHHVLNTGTKPMTVSARFKVCVKDLESPI